MKKTNSILITVVAITAVLTLSSCERVAPNFYGVLMENYGKNGKSDYTRQQGRVSMLSPGTELFQVPAWEQRAEFTESDEKKRTLHLKSSDNTEFSANPLYSYKAIENRVVDLVFQNSRLGSGDDFMRNLEDNVLEPIIYDVIKEASRQSITDTLMAVGGSLRFEQLVEGRIRKSFEEKGIELLTFSSNLDFSKKVKEKIDSRNEVNTNLTVLDQQIIEQRKKNELARLETEYNKIVSEGLTEQILTDRFIKRWDGQTPLYGVQIPVSLMKPIK